MMSSRKRQSRSRSRISDRKNSAAGGARRHRLPIWKKALFSLLTCVAFFVLLELLLWLCGVRPITYEEDPYVGFTSQIPLFVEQRGEDGVTYLATAQNKRRFFNDQEFPRDKADGVTRIFCTGGSTTFGRPYGDPTSFCGWLRAFLPSADPSRRWEVINAGGISYASYRVALLMEELIAYEPDLFIVYCGHNEFLERRTYEGIIETPAPVRGLGAALSHTRTYALLWHLVAKIRSEDAEPDNRSQLPGEVETVLDKSIGPQHYTRDEQMQQQVLAHFRYNLVRMVKIARSSGAEIIFVMPASNLRNCSPFKSEHRNGLSEARQQQWESLFERAETAYRAGHYSEALTPLDEAAAIDDQYAHLHYLRGRVLDGLERYPEAKKAFQQALDYDICPLRALSQMRDILEEVAAGWDVPLVDFAELVEDESPNSIPGNNWFLDHVHPTIDGHRMLALELIDQMARQHVVDIGSSWNEAAIDRVTRDVKSRIDPREHGRALRNLAQVLRWAGKTEDAYHAARRAVELAPKDAEAHYLLASLAQNLEKKEEAAKHYEILLRTELDPDVAPYAPNAHYAYGSILAWQGNYEEGEKHLRKALAMKPDFPEAADKLLTLQMDHGKQLLRTERPREAADRFREVLSSQPEDAEAHAYLGVALLKQGQSEAAIAQLKRAIQLNPRHAFSHNNLGVILARSRQFDQAEYHFRQATQIDPGYQSAQANLEALLQEKNNRR